MSLATFFMVMVFIMLVYVCTSILMRAWYRHRRAEMEFMLRTQQMQRGCRCRKQE